MNDYPLASRAGVTKKAIKKALNCGIDEEVLFDFIHGDLNLIHKTLPPPSGKQAWESTGKRYVHLEEARFVAKHFLRNTIRPANDRALLLSGMDPALACLPWALSGIASHFVAYESNPNAFQITNKKLSEERKKLKSCLPAEKACGLALRQGDILNKSEEVYGVIDLDFCNNQLRTEERRTNILKLIDSNAPLEGPFIFRTTLHLGRVNNSREDVEQHIEEFEKELREPTEGFQRYKIRASDRSPYQSSLPMVSLIWILEARRGHEGNIGETK